MFLEFIFGFISGSLALVSDAVHMFTHFFALSVSLFAISLAARTAPVDKTFGYYRIEVLAAFINGITIVLSVFWIIYEAFERFLNPQKIELSLAFGIAALGLVVNLITAYFLMKGDRENINLKSSFIHMLSDALSSVAIIVGYIVIYYTSWYFIDVVLALLVSLVIFRWAYGVLKSSFNTLLESSPVPLDAVRAHILACSGVQDIHDLHVWEITGNMYNLTAHVQIKKEDLGAYKEIMQGINKDLKEKFKIVHSTLQFEW